MKDLHVFFPLQVRSTSSLPAKARRYSRTTENSTSWWTLKGALSFEYTGQHIVYNGVYATASLFFHFHCSHVKYVMLLLSNANIETRVINSIFIPLYKISLGILLTCYGLNICVVSSYQQTEGYFEECYNWICSCIEDQMKFHCVDKNTETF